MRQTYLELSALSLEQTFCNESFSFFNDFTIQDGVSDFEIRNQPQKRNREKHEGGKEGEESKEEGEGEGSRKRSRKENGKGEEELEKRKRKKDSDRKSALRYRDKKKSEAEKLKQKVNDLEEKNKLLKNEVNELSKEFLELRDFIQGKDIRIENSSGYYAANEFKKSSDKSNDIYNRSPNFTSNTVPTGGRVDEEIEAVEVIEVVEVVEMVEVIDVVVVDMDRTDANSEKLHKVREDDVARKTSTNEKFSLSSSENQIEGNEKEEISFQSSYEMYDWEKELKSELLKNLELNELTDGKGGSGDNNYASKEGIPLSILKKSRKLKDQTLPHHILQKHFLMRASFTPCILLFNVGSPFKVAIQEIDEEWCTHGSNNWTRYNSRKYNTGNSWISFDAILLSIMHPVHVKKGS
ncbi:hypothetical protein Glove_29g155 [Diversispora epigaea]|uniref:BZIP domain-containing protein n=1 Tax=Diversispora epigaea TaxID=1348612 RepID=A0A397JJV9_9GLOM|nr:hypothetical protein Glove_29g155 [Diversispora epigaea]